MSGERALPEQASLRYLKLEAKRRRAAGEFATLHDAQHAIAREHGQPGWTALKEAVSAGGEAGNQGRALAQLRWIAARFGGAREPGWSAPDDEELREHFTDEFLARFQPGQLAARISELAPVMREDLIVIANTPFTAQGRVGGHLVMAVTEGRPPYRLRAVQERRLGEGISDPRTAAPPVGAVGRVPDQVTVLAADVAGGLGLVGLALAGASSGEREPWTFSTGWASLERAEPLHGDHVFPACQVTMAVTAVAVLRLAAAGQLRLDDRANSYLTAIRLADDTVTIRELLAHTAGVTDPVRLIAPEVPPLAAVTGPVIACTGKRGTFGFSHAGYAALGEIIAGRTGLAYADAASSLVLGPLGMRRSGFLPRWPAGPVLEQPVPGQPSGGYPAVTGYTVAADDTFGPVDGEVNALPAAGGLWTTAADLVRLGLGWPSLVPRSLAVQALRPHARQLNGAHVGLGWAVNEAAGLVGLAGEGPGTSVSLLVSVDGQRAGAALANRQIYLEGVNAGVLHLLGGGNLPGADKRLN